MVHTDKIHRFRPQSSSIVWKEDCDFEYVGCYTSRHGNGVMLVGTLCTFEISISMYHIIGRECETKSR